VQSLDVVLEDSLWSESPAALQTRAAKPGSMSVAVSASSSVWLSRCRGLRQQVDERAEYIALLTADFGDGLG